MNTDPKLPAVIDVKPTEIIVERPRVKVSKQAADSPGALLAQVRTVQRIGRAVQTQDFWLGVVAMMLRGR